MSKPKLYRYVLNPTRMVLFLIMVLLFVVAVNCLTGTSFVSRLIGLACTFIFVFGAVGSPYDEELTDYGREQLQQATKQLGAFLKMTSPTDSTEKTDGDSDRPSAQ